MTKEEKIELADFALEYLKSLEDKDTNENNCLCMQHSPELFVELKPYILNMMVVAMKGNPIEVMFLILTDGISLGMAYEQQKIKSNIEIEELNRMVR